MKIHWHNNCHLADRQTCLALIEVRHVGAVGAAGAPAQVTVGTLAEAVDDDSVVQRGVLAGYWNPYYRCYLEYQHEESECAGIHLYASINIIINSCKQILVHTQTHTHTAFIV